MSNTAVGFQLESRPIMRLHLVSVFGFFFSISSPEIMDVSLEMQIVTGRSNTCSQGVAARQGALFILRAFLYFWYYL